MKNINLLIAGFLVTGGAYAQTPTQPVQSTVQQPNAQPNNGRIQSAPGGQVPASNTGQTSRAIPQQTQSTQSAPVPGANAGQATYANPQPVEKAPIVEYDANGQVIVANPQVANGRVQYDTDGKEIPASTQPGQTVTSGQVPKVYINPQSSLPFQQYQPKPTGQISPIGARPGGAPVQSGRPR